jgi:hypothetical protein
MPCLSPGHLMCPASKAVIMTPLADLHRHLEGSIRPATAIELAARAGISKPPAQWRSAFVAADREEGLLPYLAKIENATSLVRTLDDWRRVTAGAGKVLVAGLGLELGSGSAVGSQVVGFRGCLHKWP